MKAIFKALGLFLVIVLVFSACRRNNNNNNEQPPLVEDGFYVVGSGVANDSMVLSAQMQPGYVEGEGFRPVLREGMYQKYFYAHAGDQAFIVKQQAGANRITWGIDGDWTVVRPDSVFKCNIKKNGGYFSVPSDGFYLFVIDTNLMRAYLLKVYYWGVIGNGTNGGWSDDSQQKMDVVSMSDTNAVWKIENLTMFPGEFKFRFNSWWTYYYADTNAEANGDPKFFTNLGGDLTRLTPGGGNISVDQSGKYTVELDFSLGSDFGFSATTTRTGDAEFDDISLDTLSIVGSGVGHFENGDTVWVNDWDLHGGLDLEYTTTDNNEEIFVIDSVVLTNGALFKFVLNHSWDRSWGYNNVTVTGDVDSITGVDDGYGGVNFQSTANRIYKITFKYNGYTRNVEVNFVDKGAFTPVVQDNPSLHTFSFIGSAFYRHNNPDSAQTNWDEDFLLDYQGESGGVYTFTISGLHFIGGGEFKIRRDQDWGFNFGYDDVTVTGDVSNIEDADPSGGNSNFKVVNDATYNVTLTMDQNYQNVTVDFEVATR